MKRQKGFTLLELIAAITILAILATLLAPGFRDVIRSNRLSSAANSFLSALNLARSEAVKLNAPVVICKSDVDNTPSGQAPRCATGGGFEQGWVVFVDADNDAEIDTEELPWFLRNHALFVGFAPAENPSIAIAVVAEHGGGGSSVAAPVAAGVLARALQKDP